MQLINTLGAVFGVLALSNAFVIPKGTPDGVYNVDVNAAGDVVLHKLSDLLDLPGVGKIESRDASPNTLAKRDSFECFPHTLVSNDIERAAYNLGQTCGEFYQSPTTETH